MRFFRQIAVVLILVMASSSSLAAICAASCASHSAISSSAPDSIDMSNMEGHCHEDSLSKHKNTPNEKTKSCVMGAACNLTQVISVVDSLSKYIDADTSNILFSTLVISDKSVDLPPPLKPPA